MRSAAASSTIRPAYMLVLWPSRRARQRVRWQRPVRPSPRRSSRSRRCSWTSRSATCCTAWCSAGRGPGRRAEALALGAAALYVFNPVTWYDSALWGQTDSVGRPRASCSVSRPSSAATARARRSWARSRPWSSPSSGWCSSRSWRCCSSGATCSARLRPATLPWGPAWLRGWLAREQGWVRLVTSGSRGAGHVPRASRCRSAWTSPATSS